MLISLLSGSWLHYYSLVFYPLLFYNTGWNSMSQCKGVAFRIRQVNPFFYSFAPWWSKPSITRICLPWYKISNNASILVLLHSMKGCALRHATIRTNLVILGWDFTCRQLTISHFLIRGNLENFFLNLTQHLECKQNNQDNRQVIYCHHSFSWYRFGPIIFKDAWHSP